MRTLGALLATGTAGAAIALGAAAGLGAFSASTTTVREIPAPASASEPEPASFATASKPLTIHEIYDRAAPGVVQVTATSRVRTQANPFLDPFGFGGPITQTQRALGSGFVVDKAGHIVTNYHVVQGASRVEVSFSNQERLPARIVGRDPSTDIAVLQVRATSRALTPLTLGDSDLVRVGDAVVAIGNPLGEDTSITAGIVSALERRIYAPNGAPIDHAIQTDAALNHGNSGGPLLNARGQVVGVTSQIQTTGSSSGNIGIGFAIPVNTVSTVVAQLISHGYVQHPFIGRAGARDHPVRREALPPAGQPRPAREQRLREDGRGDGRPARREAAGDRRRRHVAARRRHHRQGRRRPRRLRRHAAPDRRAEEARRLHRAPRRPRREDHDLEREARAATAVDAMLNALKNGPANVGAGSRTGRRPARPAGA